MMNIEPAPPSILRVKVCGITRLEDAKLACELGTDALGFIFYEKSPRYLSPKKAARISAKLPPQHISYVGVFANPSIVEIENTLAEIGLNAIQLHGEHDFDLIKHFRKMTRIICAFNISPGFNFEILELYRHKIDAFLLDGYKEGKYGGSGELVDWRKAQVAKKYGNVILAGGLNPENIKKAVRIAAPYSVDVNSGVEDRPGIKNHQKLVQLFYNIKDYRRDWQPASESTFPFA